MRSLTVYGFNHTAFVLSDLDPAIAFFRDFLGFELTSRAPRDQAAIQAMTGLEGAEVEIAYLRGHGQWIELIRYLAPADRAGGLPKIYQDGAGHVAFDIDDIEVAVSGVEDFGLQPVGEVVTIDQGPNRGRKVVYLQSPEGLSVEFIQVPL